MRKKKKSCEFACLGSHSSLATRKGTSVEVVKAECHTCSSQLCFSFGANEPTALQQAAAQESQLWDCYQLAGSKTVAKSEAAKL